LNGLYLVVRLLAAS